MTSRSTIVPNGLRAAALLGLILGCSLAFGAQTQVYGKVLAVEPIIDGPVGDCATLEKPAPDEGLAALLTWDLQARPNARRACRQQRAAQVAGYRVTYAYAGREFNAVLPEHPGTKVPLTLELD